MRRLSDVAPDATEGDANSPRRGGVPREGSVDIRMLLCGDINGSGADDDDVGGWLYRAMYQGCQSVVPDRASLDGNVSLHGQERRSSAEDVVFPWVTEGRGEVLNFPYWHNWGATV